MRLYNSNGELMDAEYYMGIDSEDMDWLCHKLFEVVNGTSLETRSPDPFTVEVYCTRKSGSAIEGACTRVCGFGFLKNQADGEFCGYYYFSCKEDDFNERDYYKIMSKEFLCLSGNDQNLFPEVNKLGRLLVDDPEMQEMKKRDCYSVKKNLYLFDKTHDQAEKGKVWNAYCAIKPVCRNAHYKGNTVFFKTADGEEGQARVNTMNGQSYIECKGNYYPTPASFVEALKEGIEYDEYTFGTDESFKEYVLHDTPIEPEDVQKEEVER